MSAPYRLSAQATQQRDAIVADLAQHSPRAAEDVYDAIEAACARLAEMPGLGRAREDFTDQPVKFWPVKGYWVIYDPARTPLTILAVYHQARDLQTILKPE